MKMLAILRKNSLKGFVFFLSISHYNDVFRVLLARISSFLYYSSQ